jgi:hypothetical protein
LPKLSVCIPLYFPSREEGLKQILDKNPELLDGTASDIHRNSPETTQEKSYHALFAFWWIADIACFFLFLSFKHAQDIRESNWDQERLYPFWIGHSGFFEFKSVGFPIFVHRLDAKTTIASSYSFPQFSTTFILKVLSRVTIWSRRTRREPLSIFRNSVVIFVSGIPSPFKYMLAFIRSVASTP